MSAIEGFCDVRTEPADPNLDILTYPFCEMFASPGADRIGSAPPAGQLLSFPGVAPPRSGGLESGGGGTGCEDPGELEELGV